MEVWEKRIDNANLALSKAQDKDMKKYWKIFVTGLNKDGLIYQEQRKAEDILHVEHLPKRNLEKVASELILNVYQQAKQLE